MKVYNQTKTQILLTYDLEKGYLKEDTIKLHIPEVKEIKEVGHYETINIYENGGRDVKWIVDVKGQEYVPAKDIEEPIFVYIPYSQEEIIKNERNTQLSKLKKYLSDTDYVTCKITEALAKYVMSNDFSELKTLLEKYDSVLANRKTYRNQISLLESAL